MTTARQNKGSDASLQDGHVKSAATKVSDFSIGDFVTHIVCGPGVVAATADGDVVVYYAGTYTHGAYDAEWFAKHPTSLQIARKSAFSDLLAAIREVIAADEHLLDVAEYALEPNPRAISKAQRRMDDAWAKVRAAIAKAGG